MPNENPKAADKVVEKTPEKPKVDVKLDTGQKSGPVVKAVPFVAALEVRARELHRAGDFAGEAVLTDLAVTASALKQKTAAALSQFKGERACLIKGLNELL